MLSMPLVSAFHTPKPPFMVILSISRHAVDDACFCVPYRKTSVCGQRYYCLPHGMLSATRVSVFRTANISVHDKHLRFWYELMSTSPQAHKRFVFLNGITLVVAQRLRGSRPRSWPPTARDRSPRCGRSSRRGCRGSWPKSKRRAGAGTALCSSLTTPSSTTSS